MRSGRLGIVAIAVGVLVVVLLAGTRDRSGGPLSPDSTAPDGTRALVELVRGTGATVAERAGVPGADVDVALVLVDTLGRDDAAGLEQWVEGGGRLVVADPGSLLTPPLAGSVDGVQQGSCPVGGLAAVTAIDVGEAQGFVPSDGAVACFAGDRGAAVVVEQRGSGVIVSVGGQDLFTNASLGEADNALFAATLLGGPGTSTVLTGRSLAGSGDSGLVDLVGDPVRAALAQLAVAFAALVAWRARRHGRPFVDAAPVRVDASSLTVAVGRLLERSSAPAHAAALLRQRARADLSPPLGLHRHATTDEVVAAVTRATDLDSATVRSAVAGPVHDDDDLVDVAAALDRIHHEINTRHQETHA